MSNAWASAARTGAGSLTAASPTKQTPSARCSRICCAAWMARRVLPTPPVPTRVSRRTSGRCKRVQIAAASCSRRMSGVNCTGRTCSAAVPGAGAELIGKAALSFCIAGDPLLSLRTSGARKTACFASQDGYNIRYWPCRKSFCRPNLHKHSEHWPETLLTTSQMQDSIEIINEASTLSPHPLGKFLLKFFRINARRGIAIVVNKSSDRCLARLISRFPTLIVVYQTFPSRPYGEPDIPVKIIAQVVSHGTQFHAVLTFSAWPQWCSRNHEEFVLCKLLSRKQSDLV